jgi:hypothetical protein
MIRVRFGRRELYHDSLLNQGFFVEGECMVCKDFVEQDVDILTTYIP